MKTLICSLLLALGICGSCFGQVYGYGYNVVYPQPLPVYRPIYPLAWGVVVPYPIMVIQQQQPVIVVPPPNVTIRNNTWITTPAPNPYRDILNRPRY